MLLCGMRATGNVHLGHYLGIIRPFIEYDGDKVFMLADLYGGENYVDSCVAILEKFGIAPVIQSHNEKVLPLFNELLSSVNMGQLSRMTQYKDKKDKDPTVKLFTYPVLMMADIFAHKASKVLVGRDQKQHLELTRDVWDRLHNPKFPKPVPYIAGLQIMDLKDASKKMSKSGHHVSLLDNPDCIYDKIMTAKSGVDMKDNTPEMINLKNIYRALGGKERFELVKSFKQALAEKIINILGG